MSYDFTLTDKALMLRAARLMVEVAQVEAASHGPVWSATPDGRVAKRRYDRLLRDARDLRALTKRFEVLHPPVAVDPPEGFTVPGKVVGSDVVR